jgi:hypothetical protein
MGGVNQQVLGLGYIDVILGKIRPLDGFVYHSINTIVDFIRFTEKPLLYCYLKVLRLLLSK